MNAPRVIAVDWSARSGPEQRRALWVGEAAEGDLVRLEAVAADALQADLPHEEQVWGEARENSRGDGADRRRVTVADSQDLAAKKPDIVRLVSVWMQATAD